MIKRSEAKSKNTRRKHRSAEVRPKRRLQMEGLERRELLAVLLEPPTQPLAQLPEYPINRNIGAVQAFTAIESERLNETGQNDFLTNADILPLGTGAGQQDTIDVTGRLPVGLAVANTSGFTADIDTFGFDLRAGDILDVATLGAAGGITIRDANNSLHMSNDVLIGGVIEPRQDRGNANATVVIPSDGRYFVTVAPQLGDTTANYVLGLRVYRPVTESLAIGDTQILYLDYNGAVVDNNIFNQQLADDNAGLPVGGVTRVRSLLDSLPILGLEFGDVAAANTIIDTVESEMVRIFNDLTFKGNNGDIESANANLGDFGIRVLNSRDHFGTVSFDDPRVSRLLVGGIGADFGVDGVFGIAENVDIGNFNLNELGIFALDAFADLAPTVPRGPSSSDLDIVSRFLGSVAAHEAGHILGMIHTENGDDPPDGAGFNAINTVSDAGGTVSSLAYMLGLGPDFVFGTRDDVLPTFNDDFFQVGEVPDLEGFAFNRVTAALAHGLSSGTTGTSVTGRAFNDLNSDGNGNGDPGLPGVFVFADANNNGSFDPAEASDLTDANGNFTLDVGSRVVNVVAEEPIGFGATTPTVVSGATANIAFGFSQAGTRSTGVVFSDNNGNRFRDPGEPGLEGVFVYLDLNGNDVPELGEPRALSQEDGSYQMPFPGPGPYTIRVVTEAGFELTTPVTGEYPNGTPTGNNFDFGFLPSLDYGDAPDSYGTTGSLGAKHGITSGLTIGAAVDRELEGQPNATATGDDIAGIDDEDGVLLLSPLGPGAEATFSVEVNNTLGGVAYLQGFMDFNGDGDFTDSGEQFAKDVVVASNFVGSQQVLVNVPTNAKVGDTFARFRLSQTPGIGATGFAETGEVEDYTYPILTEARLANNDTASVPRNSTQEIEVLANDFQTAQNPLEIRNLILIGTEQPSGQAFTTEGSVRIADDSKSVFYTPPTGFIGPDTFGYTVVDSLGNSDTAYVNVNVTFETAVPIALDDIFQLPEGSNDRALNVLDNDISSVAGGISIVSATRGSEGGSVRIVGGGLSLRYTPQDGFDGTEQFTYTIVDAAGQTDTATVTVKLLPGSLAEEKVAFSIGIFDSTNNTIERSNVKVGEEFLVRVSVDDIERVSFDQGVASAFLDLLYTDELATVVTTASGNPDITFGPLFNRPGALQPPADIDTPGLVDEVGAVQAINDVKAHEGPAELFTIRMRAVSPGVAVIQGDPADVDDRPQSETILKRVVPDDGLGDRALTVAEQRFGSVELTITPRSGEFTSAIDDSYPDSIDSDGNVISNPLGGTSSFRLDVLANDNLGATGNIREFTIVQESDALGSVTIDTNGSSNLNDAVLRYSPNGGANGLAQFTYRIVTEDNIVSTAEVTVSLGNQRETSDVAFDMSLVQGDGSGAALDPATIGLGDRIGVQVDATDLRFASTYVFAGYMDVLYNADVLRPSDTDMSDGFDFDVRFGADYAQDPNNAATAARPGIIDEVGTFATESAVENGGELFTLFFDVIGSGPLGLVGSPADSEPFSFTLLFGQDDEVQVSKIRFDKLDDVLNTRIRQDVDGDGFVSPRDALLVLNDLSRSSAEGEQAGSSSGGNVYYTDVNGDNQVTPIDALQVINYLIRNRSGDAAGEQLVGLQGNPVSDSSDELASDEVISDLSDESNIVGTPLVDSSNTTNVGLVSSDSGMADDDDDDLLSLLADDVADHWS